MICWKSMLAVRKQIMCCHVLHHSIPHNTLHDFSCHQSETSRAVVLSQFFLPPFLWIRVTFAVLQSSVKMPSSKDFWNISLNGPVLVFVISLRHREWKQCGPSDLLPFRFRSFFLTSSSIMLTSTSAGPM